MNYYDLDRKVGTESSKSYKRKCSDGFFDKFMQGLGCELGYEGYHDKALPILPNCDGYDMKTPGYDGKRIPVEDGYYDYVYSSHTLEHISDFKQAIQEWFRVIKVGGHIITVVPHRDLYEKKLTKPSRYNEDHKRFYQTSTLEPNSFRVRFLEDSDIGYDYTIPPEIHPTGELEITLVIQKIQKPTWSIK